MEKLKKLFFSIEILFSNAYFYIADDPGSQLTTFLVKNFLMYGMEASSCLQNFRPDLIPLMKKLKR